ncbi:endonuclease/exonuclease/phosphatase family protein [Microbacterium sp. No. 7]|uniref:endonuclease/exonuclease/phosphatase family protein n=1 Tax=Microbacterium sp. No. 7 TaxID=1714373 RepID=UPI0006D202F1|nr:endonuclease/exonuclease/phosphatase family protein [Microbacterium sp. No. 7]ALJ19955.1 endonuclease [Microbacterium sp. No. 7]
MLRLIGILASVLFAIAAAVLTWPQFFRLERTFPIAQIVSMRGALTLAFAAILVLALLACAVRAVRGFAASIALVALLAVVAGAGILVVRGLGEDTLPEPTASSVRVMTWNTAGVDAQVIARAAVEADADIVALPETTIDTGTEVAVAMRELGRPMWAHHESFADRPGYAEWAANSTTLLISPDLGDYAVIQSNSDGTTNTSTVPTVVAMPVVEGAGPTVVAVHAVAPRPQDMEGWRADLQWLADQCASDSVIMAGDFNATVDSMMRLGVDGGLLGRCHDAAVATGNGAVGTWSTAWPELLGSPIDHVMATSAWEPTGSVVLSSLDDAGSDHRPLIVQYEPASAG